jgi:hypothetical protein
MGGILVMAESNSGAIRRVAWSELCPWLSILRVFRLAISLRSLVLGTVGILLTAVGWQFFSLTLMSKEELMSSNRQDCPEAMKWLKPYAENPGMAVTDAAPDPTRGFQFQPRYRDFRNEPLGTVQKTWTTLSQPTLSGLSSTGLATHDIVCLILCGVWAVAVWAYFGTAICRGAAVRLAADEPTSLGAVLRFANTKSCSCFFAPLWPLGGVLLATLLILVLGWIMRCGFGMLVAGVAWPLVLVAGFLMAILLLGVLFGWPLMWAAVSVEGSDSFDALSRSYAYVFQRPLHYLFYTAVAGFLGWLGWILVQYFAAGVIWLGYWAAAWGCGNERIASIVGAGGELGGLGSFGAGLICFWATCVKLLAVGYLYSYFWTAAVAVYLLLRRNVDATEMDEVFLDADASEQAAEGPSPAAQPAGGPTAEENHE